MTNNGWDASAAAWIASQGERGDFGRQFVLDRPMLARVQGRGFATALDVGCGEGRFCRMMQSAGIRTVGVDPVPALIQQARALDPTGDYRVLGAEAIDLGGFDLAVSYLTLIDIDDYETALARMAAALRPGGTLLIANLNSFNTAGMPAGWVDGRFSIDHYLEPRRIWSEWRGIGVWNWHRPFQAYVSALLALGLELRHFAEPAPHGGPADKADRYRRTPWFHVMEWQKRQ